MFRPLRFVRLLYHATAQKHIGVPLFVPYMGFDSVENVAAFPCQLQQATALLRTYTGEKTNRDKKYAVLGYRTERAYGPLSDNEVPVRRAYKTHYGPLRAALRTEADQKQKKTPHASMGRHIFTFDPCFSTFPVRVLRVREERAPSLWLPQTRS